MMNMSLTSCNRGYYEVCFVVSGKANEIGLAAQAGVPVDYGKSAYLDKDGYGKKTPDYYLVHHEDAYVDGVMIEGTYDGHWEER